MQPCRIREKASLRLRLCSKTACSSLASSAAIADISFLGGSAKELRDEEERHAIECKATHGLIGAGSRSAYTQKRRVLRNTGRLRWITALLVAIARWL
jgi:hypothetical protein